MACSITSGFTRSCNESVGGIKNVYLINYLTSFADDTISGGEITVTGSPTAYKFELKGAVNSFEQVGEVSRDNGSVFFNQTLTAVFPGMDATQIDEFTVLSKGLPQALIEDYNGNLLLAGLENGLDVQVTAGTGAAMGDLNGFTVVLSGMEKLLAPVADLSEFTIA